MCVGDARVLAGKCYGMPIQMSLSCTRVCEAAGATKALGWHLFGFGFGLAGWRAAWHSLFERLSLYAFLTSAAIEERQPKGSPKGRAADRQPAVRQSARHNDGDKSLSSSVSTRNVAKSTNVSAAGVRCGRGKDVAAAHCTWHMPPIRHGKG